MKNIGEKKKYEQKKKYMNCWNKNERVQGRCLEI